MKMFLVVAFVIALVILGPIATIWSVNTLFPVVNIPYTFDTWCAAIILAGVFKTTITKKD
jgi:hypothetical protein